MPALTSIARFLRLRFAAIPLVLLFPGCNKEHAQIDSPRLNSDVVMREVRFYSSALRREMPYRVFLPARPSREKKFPAVYLLHGGGEDYRAWSNDSDIARFATNAIL